MVQIGQFFVPGTRPKKEHILIRCEMILPFNCLLFAHILSQVSSLLLHDGSAKKESLSSTDLSTIPNAMHQRFLLVVSQHYGLFLDFNYTHTHIYIYIHIYIYVFNMCIYIY